MEVVSLVYPNMISKVVNFWNFLVILGVSSDINTLFNLILCRYTPVGRSFYSPDHGRRQHLGEILESWHGFYQSIRPTQMGLSLSIDQFCNPMWWFVRFSLTKSNFHLNFSFFFSYNIIKSWVNYKKRSLCFLIFTMISSNSKHLLVLVLTSSFISILVSEIFNKGQNWYAVLE